nr:hypothetical protein [Rhizobium straminoryzae]
MNALVLLPAMPMETPAPCFGRAGSVALGHIGDKYHELLTAKPTNALPAIDGAGQFARHSDEHMVVGPTAGPMVDGFEAIDVAEEHDLWQQV